MLVVHIFEPLCPCEDKMSIKKVFHFWPLKIAASMCSQSSLDGPYWPCTLAAISEGQKWKIFLMCIAPFQGNKNNTQKLICSYALTRTSPKHFQLLNFGQLWPQTTQICLLEFLFVCLVEFISSLYQITLLALCSPISIQQM